MTTSSCNNIQQVSIAPGTPWCIPIIAAHFEPPGQTFIVGKLWPSSQFSPIPVFVNTKILLGHNHAHSYIYCFWQLQCQRWVVVIDTKSPEKPKIVTIWSFMAIRSSWATVSSWSCFCWLYRASPSLAAKNIINLTLVLSIWWCPCVESSLVLLEEGVCYDQCIFLAKLY